MNKKTILIVGDAMLDKYIWTTVDRISPEAPVPVALTYETTYSLGGAANAAANVRGLGNEAILISACGKDKNADELSKLLRAHGVSDYMVAEKGRPTTIKTRVMAGAQQLLRIDNEKTKYLYTKGRQSILNKFEKYLPATDAVIFSDYGKGTLEPEAVQRMITLCNRQSIKCFVDPKGVEWEPYFGAYCITPNFKEFSDFYYNHLRERVDETNFKGAAQRTCRDLGLDHLALTRGARGIYAATQRDGLDFPVSAQEVVDVCGAGDTVIAVLAVKIAEGFSFREAVKWANVAAGVVVGRVGTCPIRHYELYNG